MNGLNHLTRRWPEILLLGALLAGVLWLRWPTLGADTWNVDETIHAAAARTILEGGVLYRDAVDIRNPLSYYAVAAVFAVFGENNLWAVRCFIAVMVATSAFWLFLIGRKLGGRMAGLMAALLYALLASCLFSSGDAFAANTEWFVAFFSSAAAALYLAGPARPTPRRLFGCGFLLGAAYLSKQPALLEIAVPLAALVYLTWRGSLARRTLGMGALTLLTGWLLPVLTAVLYFAAHGALHDYIFYTWSYNLSYYGPEISFADRLGALSYPGLLLWQSQPALFIIWMTGAVVTVHRLGQRVATPAEIPGNPGLVYLVAWSLTTLIAAASSGRTFDHYSIQFLPALCLGGGLALGWLADRLISRDHGLLARITALLILSVTGYELVAAINPARSRTLPPDTSTRVAAYIRANSAPTDRVFVWGFQPDIYLLSDRRPASRYLIASFLSGMIPWTNTAPERDTTYAIVPGAMDNLLRDLTATPPAFIVDCSVGPNRHWQKYPLEKFPRLKGFIQSRYKVVEAGQFVPQGFRLFQMLAPGEPATSAMIESPLATEIASQLKLSLVGHSLVPIRASSPHSTTISMVEGQLEYFVHAPSSITYRVPAGTKSLRGGFGIKSGAYAAENPNPTDGAEFIISWHPDGEMTQVFLRRALRPREITDDRGMQSFRAEFTSANGGELELKINAGPAGNPASDWTFWTGLLLENSP